MDDVVSEYHAERFNVLISTLVQGVGITTPAISIVIRDNEVAALVLQPQQFIVAEGGSAEYNVRLASMPTLPVTVTVSSSNIGSVAVSPPALTFSTSDWNTDKVVTVIGVQDSGLESESVTLTHEITSRAIGYSSGLEGMIVTVNTEDDDFVVLGMPQSIVVDESTAELQLTLTLAPPVPYQVPINVALYAGAGGNTHAIAATLLEDYVFSSTVLTMEANTASKTFSIATIDNDLVSEADEVFAVAFSPQIDGVAAEFDAVEVTIRDDDQAQLIISESQLSLAEGGSAEYTIRLATIPTEWVSVLIGSSDISAVATGTGLLNFTPVDWDRPRSITVMAVNDADFEGESVSLIHEVVSAAPGYRNLMAAGVAVSVTDDDEALLSISGLAFEVAEDARSLELTLTIEPPVSYQVVVGIAITSDSNAATADAILGEDYGQPPTTVTIEPSQGGKTVSVAILDDEVTEFDEVFTFAISTSTQNISIGVREAKVTISDDDSATLIGSHSHFSLSEGETAEYTVALGSQPGGVVEVHIGVEAVGLDGMPGAIDRNVLTFGVDNWQVAQAVVIRTWPDGNNVGGGMTLTHTAVGGNYDNATPVVVTVDVRDPGTPLSLSTVNISSAPIIELHEALGVAPSTAIAAGSQMDHPNSLRLNFSTPITDGALFLYIDIDHSGRDDIPGATAGRDHKVSQDRLLWRVEPRQYSFSWPVVDDNLIEGDEVFTVSFAEMPLATEVESIAPGVNIFVSAMTTDQTVILTSAQNIKVVIKDNDVLEVGLEDALVQEDAGYVHVPLLYHGVDGASLARPLMFSVDTHAGTAAAGVGNDYDALQNYKLVLDPATHNPSSGRIRIPIPIYATDADDGVREFTVSISSSNSSVRILDDTAIVTIHEAASAPIGISIMDQAVSESDGELALTFALDGHLPQPVRLVLGTEDGLAVRGVDYELDVAEVVIPAGITQYSTAVPVLSIIDDNTVEFDGKHFFVTAAAAHQGFPFLNIARARIDIADTDTSEISFVPILREGDSQSRVEVRLSAPLEVPFDVYGTAIIGSEEASNYGVEVLPNMLSREDISIDQSFAIEVAAYQNSAVLYVAIEDDRFFEGDESLYLGLFGIASGASPRYSTSQVDSIIGKLHLAYDVQPVVVQDNDAPFAIMLEDLELGESANIVEIVPSSAALPTEALDIAVRTRSDTPGVGSAIAGQDYSELDYVVRYNPILGQLPSIYLAINDNRIVDRYRRTFFLDLSYEYAGEATTVSAEIAIINDELVEITMSPDEVEVAEDIGMVELQVLLSRSLDYPLNLAVAASSSTGQQSGRDYMLAATNFTIEPGQYRHVLQLSIIDDVRIDGGSVLQLGDVTVSLVLDDGNISVGNGSSTVYIVDNEIPPQTVQGITFSNLEFEEDVGEVAFRISILPLMDVPVQFNIELSAYSCFDANIPGSRHGVDYNRLPSVTDFFAGTIYETIIIPAGESSIDVALIEIIDDGNSEDDLYFCIDAYGTGGIAVTNGSRIDLVIRDDDDHAVVNFDLQDIVVEEGDGVVTISFGTENTRHIREGDFMDVSLRVSDMAVQEGGVAATEGLDYRLNSNVVTFGQNDSGPYQISFEVIDDSIRENQEIVRLQLALHGSASEYISLSEGGIVDVIINDNDQESVQLTLERASIVREDIDTEGAQNAGSYLLVLSSPLGYDLVVNIATRDASDGNNVATERVDYVPYSGTKTIPAGHYSVAVKFEYIDDDIAEVYELLLVDVSTDDSSVDVVDSAGVLVGDAGLVIGIDDDDSLKVSAEANFVVYEGAGIVMVPVMLSQPLEQDSSFAININGRDAIYDLVNPIAGTEQQVLVEFPEGVQIQHIAINVLNDNIYNQFLIGQSTLQITLLDVVEPSGLIANISSDIGVISIIDDDYRSSGYSDSESLIETINIYAAPGAGATLRANGGNFIHSRSRTERFFKIEGLVPGNVVYLTAAAGRPGVSMNINGHPVDNFQESPPFSLEAGVNEAYIEASHGNDSIRVNINIIYQYPTTEARVVHLNGNTVKENSSLQMYLELDPPPPVDGFNLLMRSPSAISQGVLYADGIDLSSSGLIPLAAGQRIVTLEFRASDDDDISPNDITIYAVLDTGGSPIPVQFTGGNLLATILPLTAADATLDYQQIAISRLRPNAAPSHEPVGFRISVNPAPTTPLPVRLFFEPQNSGRNLVEALVRNVVIGDEGGRPVATEYLGYATGTTGQLHGIIEVMYPADTSFVEWRVTEHYSTTRPGRDNYSMGLLPSPDGRYFYVPNEAEFDFSLDFPAIRYDAEIAIQDRIKTNEIVIHAGETVPIYFKIVARIEGLEGLVRLDDFIGFSVASESADIYDYGITDARGVYTPNIHLSGDFHAFTPGNHRRVYTHLLNFVSILDNDSEEEVHVFKIHGNSERLAIGSCVSCSQTVRIVVKPARASLSLAHSSGGIVELSASGSQSAPITIISSGDKTRPIPFNLVIFSADGSPVREGDYIIEGWNNHRGLTTEYQEATGNVVISGFMPIDAGAASFSISFTANALDGYDGEEGAFIGNVVERLFIIGFLPSENIREGSTVNTAPLRILVRR
ncbi:MAG: Calx-beta domain-containing protein [Candidatus Porifericomitaceae bacterium WSBS_2022_MAG_OTU9]